MLGEQGGNFFRAANLLRFLNLREIGVQIVEAAEFLDERRRSLFADAGDALDIVDRIPHQRLDVDERARLDSETIAHLRALRWICRASDPTGAHGAR